MSYQSLTKLKVRNYKIIHFDKCTSQSVGLRKKVGQQKKKNIEKEQELFVSTAYIMESKFILSTTLA